MKDRWMTPSADADEKQNQHFEAWHAAQNIPFENREAETAYRHRVMLIKDAVRLEKVPERIPVCPASGHFPIEYAGISWAEAMYDYAKLTWAWKKYHDDFATDVFNGPRGVVPGKTLDVLDFQLYRWAGNGLK